ncbi:MAG TPA: FixH family protein [Ktedonobacterales bacterium]
MRLSLRRTYPARGQALSRMDRLAFGIIWGGALMCFALLAWGHLGLGAWIMPPAGTAQEQVAPAGPYRVALRLDSGQLTARGPNTVSFVLKDVAGHPVEGATVVVAPSMATMAMDAPAVGAPARGNGRYEAHPVFAMAGEWRLRVRVRVAAPGQPERTATFAAGVRWHP